MVATNKATPAVVIPSAVANRISGINKRNEVHGYRDMLGMPHVGTEHLCGMYYFQAMVAAEGIILERRRKRQATSRYSTGMSFFSMM